MESILDTLGGWLGFGGQDGNIKNCAGGGKDPCEAVAACSGDNPCEAAWQATYLYYADRQFDMAKVQALLGLLYGYIQYESADRTADRQYDIANRQMAIAEEEYARYKCVYVECEDRYASELCAIQYPTVDYELYADRLERDVRRKFATARQTMDRVRSRYCIADHLRLSCKMAQAEALSVVAARDTGYRYAETRHDVLEARRHARKMDMVKMGRDIKTDQSTDYSGSMSYATNALGNKLAARSSLYSTIFGVGQGLLNSYYTANINPFPYGSGWGGGTAAGSGGTVGGGLHSGAGNF